MDGITNQAISFWLASDLLWYTIVGFSMLVLMYLDEGGLLPLFYGILNIIFLLYSLYKALIRGSAMPALVCGVTHCWSFARLTRVRITHSRQAVWWFNFFFMACMGYT